jgi:DNA-binding MarR family transcriptional regulator
MTSAAKPDLGILLAASYLQFVSELREVLAADGFPDLGRADGFVFRTLAQGPMTVSDLAARLGITKQGAAQIIDDMQSRGMVQRGHDPRDARARPVELTDRGRQALRAASAFHRRTERALVKAHGSNAVATLRALLTDLAGAPADGEPQLRIGVL